MVANATDIQKGMEVYGSSGDKIGSVAEVYPYADAGGADSGTSTPIFEEVIVEEVDVTGPASGSSAPSAGPTGSPSSGATTMPGGSFDAAGTGGSAAGATAGSATGATSTVAPPAMTTGYFKVDQGGILGIGAKHLYVPYDAVDDVVPGESVTLNCTKDEADAQYGTKPDFIQENQSS